LSSSKSEVFEHFILRYFSSQSGVSSDVFNEDDFFHLDAFKKSVFDLEEDPDAHQFEGSIFSELNLSQRYYYDSLARSNKKILILLFGTLWDPDTISYIRMLSRLYEALSREKENQETLVRQFQLWYKRTLKLGYEREAVLSRSKKLKAKDWQIIQATDRGLALFLPQNQFKLMDAMIKELSTLPYKPDVTFAFVAVSADDADAQAILKDENIPIPFLNDADAKVTGLNVALRVPAMVMVDHEGRVDYRGDVLSELDIRARIDRLMVGIFEERGAEIQRIHHEKRMKIYKQRMEKIMLLRRAEEEKKQSKYGKVLRGRKKKKD
jgi:hypothetical protein